MPGAYNTREGYFARLGHGEAHEVEPWAYTLSHEAESHSQETSPS